MSNELMCVEFESLSGIPVKLDAATVRNTLTRGNGAITDQEVAFFIRTCQAKRLDPFENGEVYLIKYGDRNPANMVVGYFAYIRRADHFPDYRGFKAGVTVLRNDGQIVQKEGACVYKAIGEQLIGGWCRVYRERNNGSLEETYMEVPLDEYSTGQSNWNAKPATMIRKVAVSQAFRAAFPNEYQGLYTAEEMQASGVIAGNAQIDQNTGEIIDIGDLTPPSEEEDDPVVTQEQKQALFSIFQNNFSAEDGNRIYKELLAKQGLRSGSPMPMSKYKVILAEAMTLAQEMRAAKSEADEEALPAE